MELPLASKSVNELPRGNKSLSMQNLSAKNVSKSTKQVGVETGISHSQTCVGRRQDGYGVHPVLYNTYRSTQATMRYCYVCWWMLVVGISLTTIIDSDPFLQTGNLNMFYMTELIKKNMVSKPFTDSDDQEDATFMDIQELDDVWIWIDKVFITYLAPSDASYESVCIIKTFLGPSKVTNHTNG